MGYRRIVGNKYSPPREARFRIQIVLEQNTVKAINSAISEKQLIPCVWTVYKLRTEKGMSYVVIIWILF